MRTNWERATAGGVACIVVLCGFSRPGVGSGQQAAVTPSNNASAAEPRLVDDEEFRVPIDKATAARIATLVDQLGSTTFAEREQATAELTKLNAQAFPRLREVYRTTSDFEVRSRIESIVRTGYIEYRVYAQFGYLGVSLSPGAITSESNPLIPPGQVGIVIENVQRGTGAEAAGLQNKDVIVSVNGKPVPGVGANAQQAFTEIIRRSGPGAEVEFHVIRGDTELTVVAKLTRAPELGKDTQATRISALPGTIAAAEASFPEWWLKHFVVTDGRKRD